MPGNAMQRAKIVKTAVQFAVCVWAAGMYCAFGFFGAALFGSNTQGNLLQNKLMGGGTAQGVLNLFVAVYVSIANATIEPPFRFIVMGWIYGKERLKECIAGSDYPFAVHFLITLSIYVASLAVCIFWPSNSSKLLTITGATGVLMCSYVCPIVNHFVLYYSLSSKEAALESMEEVKNVEEYRKVPGLGLLSQLAENVEQVILPVIIVATGGFASAISLWANFK
eukprot:TRINITY_DN6801_c0_g1_i1.p1 TRINITY_DN6801_c0_g1~~TRINITY_DN6801_c0_g1_i1.p1  ORF type:complete len:253 (-),score=48.53 TRINITY_DN6801_c0_g1_i1:318-989(-)